MNEELLTVEEVCQRLKVKRSWVYNNPDIPHVKVGRYKRFYWSDVIGYLKGTRSVILGMERQKTREIIRRSIETGEPSETSAQLEQLQHFAETVLGVKI